MSKQLELRRELGLGVAVAIVIGTVIGSGIFLVPKTMVLAVSSPWMVLGVFLFGGFLSLAGALTYAELAAAMPEAGGEYVYLREAYGPFWGFIYGWTQLWVAKSGSLATLATDGPIAAGRHLGYKSLAQMPTCRNGPVSFNVE